MSPYSGAEDVKGIKVANSAVFDDASGLIIVETDLIRNDYTAATSLVGEMRTLIAVGLTVQETITFVTYYIQNIGEITVGQEGVFITVGRHDGR